MCWVCDKIALTLPQTLPEPANLNLPTHMLTRLALVQILVFYSMAALTRPPGAIDCAVALPGSDQQVVIIIDDMGNNLRRDLAALALPGELTFAIMPYTPFGETLARRAHRTHREVILHEPMSNLHAIPVGPGGLTDALPKQVFRDTLDAALAEVPYAVGINNHMGSALTQQRPQMAWLMQELRQRDLYFVDSRTIAGSVAATVAGEFNVPHLSRDIFLDNVRDPEHIEQRFDELLHRVRRDGQAVAIGHPYPETIDVLRTRLPELAAADIRLVTASQALSRKIKRSDDEPPGRATLASVAISEERAQTAARKALANCSGRQSVPH